MAAFGKSAFSHANYALSRPTYPARLYDQILAFHHSPCSLALDLGTGHGLVARDLSPRFTQVIGTDPSEGMLQQARTATPAEQFANVSFRTSSAESLPFLKDGTVDMVTAGQAAHWFDYPRLWPELHRIVRKGGTVAFWGYGAPVCVDHTKATKIMHQFAYGTGWDEVGAFWQQPGASIVQNKMRDLPVPDTEWDAERRVYEPNKNGEGKHKGEGECFMEIRTTVAGIMALMRSWSSYFGWKEKNPEYTARKDGGDGDCVDWCMDRIVQEEGEDWSDDKFEMDIECATGLILARRK